MHAAAVVVANDRFPATMPLPASLPHFAILSLAPSADVHKCVRVESGRPDTEADDDGSEAGTRGGEKRERRAAARLCMRYIFDKFAHRSGQREGRKA